jgi:hypothetical protein
LCCTGVLCAGVICAGVICIGVVCAGGGGPAGCPLKPPAAMCGTLQ